MTVSLKECLLAATEQLKTHQIANPRRQAEEVIADSLGLRRIDLYLQFDRPLNMAEYRTCQERIVRRAQGEPCQYLAGKVDFLGCSIHVNGNVLIPRMETEILTAKICEELAQEDLTGKVLWDLCCGSGAIGIAIKKRFPALNVILSDISSAAVSIARENAQHNEVDVQILLGDLLAPFEGQIADYIVCNPPYISADEYPGLEREVRDYEPRLALVAENEGLDFYERLSRELPHHLRQGGKVWLELGHGQGDALLRLFKSPVWKDQRLENDWSQKNRFFFLEKE